MDSDRTPSVHGCNAAVERCVHSGRRPKRRFRVPTPPKVKAKLIFAWYDLWLGAYWDRKNKTLYLMLPMLGIALALVPQREGESE